MKLTVGRKKWNAASFTILDACTGFHLGPGRLCLKHHYYSILLFSKNEPIILSKLPIIPVLFPGLHSTGAE